jgi:hypothetical protein
MSQLIPVICAEVKLKAVFLWNLIISLNFPFSFQKIILDLRLF